MIDCYNFIFSMFIAVFFKKLHYFVMSQGWVIGIIARIINYNEKGLFDKTYKDELTEVYYKLVSQRKPAAQPAAQPNTTAANIQIE